MEVFTMQIANSVIAVSTLFESTREYCKPYLTDRKPEFSVTVTRGELLVEQQLLEKEALEQGLKIRKFPDPFLERSTIQRSVADYLVQRNTLMLHGSTVAVDGKAYLFTAPCGTGKSTHTRLWRELFGKRAIMVNDDKPFLQITSSCVLAYGSPWSGKHGLASNICVPLQGICSLHRGRENTISPGLASSFMELLYHQVHTPEDAGLAQKTLSLVDTLARRVPLWEMHCNKDPEAAMIAYEAMSGDGD